MIPTSSVIHPAARMDGRAEEQVLSLCKSGGKDPRVALSFKAKEQGVFPGWTFRVGSPSTPW